MTNQNGHRHGEPEKVAPNAILQPTPQSFQVAWETATQQLPDGKIARYAVQVCITEVGTFRLFWDPDTLEQMARQVVPAVCTEARSGIVIPEVQLPRDLRHVDDGE